MIYVLFRLSFSSIKWSLKNRKNVWQNLKCFQLFPMILTSCSLNAYLQNYLSFVISTCFRIPAWLTMVFIDNTKNFGALKIFVIYFLFFPSSNTENVNSFEIIWLVAVCFCVSLFYLLAFMMNIKQHLIWWLICTLDFVIRYIHIYMLNSLLTREILGKSDRWENRWRVLLCCLSHFEIIHSLEIWCHQIFNISFYNPVTATNNHPKKPFQ